MSSVCTLGPLTSRGRLLLPHGETAQGHSQAPLSLTFILVKGRRTSHGVWIASGAGSLQEDGDADLLSAEEPREGIHTELVCP